MDTLQKKIASTRIRDTQDVATAEAQSAKTSEHQRRERIRQENRQAWHEHHRHMHGLHTQLAAEHEARAQMLLEET